MTELGGKTLFRALAARYWAPLASALFVGLLYSLRVDSVFYFLQGLESQGSLLAKALAGGLGFVDISQAGNMAHVREPPLFYLMLAGLVKVFGFKLLPMKALTWAGYVLAAGLGAAFFQRRSTPVRAFVSVLFCFTSLFFFKFLSGPKTDLPFTAFVFGALLAQDLFIELFLGKATRRAQAREGAAEDDAVREEPRTAGPGVRPGLLTPALAGGLLVAAAVMTRSLGLGLAIGFAATMAFYRPRSGGYRRRAAWTAIVLLPLFLALGGWMARGAITPNPAGFDYADWFLMDLAPDSPEMTAVDFHAPLYKKIPRVGALGFSGRALRHAGYYSAYSAGALFETVLPARARANAAMVIVLFALVFAGAIRSEWRRPPLAAAFLFPYLGAVMVWPMDDARLLMPALPFIAFYLVEGLHLALAAIMSAAVAGKKAGGGDEESGPGSGADEGRSWALCALPGAIASALVVVVVILNIKADLEYHYLYASRLPTSTTKAGGFARFRFVSPETMLSFRLLDWARHNTEPGAILMYHSTPPCRLVSGRVCSPIPFSQDLGEVHRYIMEHDIDYLVLDEWGRAFPGGSGWFTENMLRPVVSRRPDDFETVYAEPGTQSMVVRVLRD